MSQPEPQTPMRDKAVSLLQGIFAQAMRQDSVDNLHADFQAQMADFVDAVISAAQGHRGGQGGDGGGDEQKASPAAMTGVPISGETGPEALIDPRSPVTEALEEMRERRRAKRARIEESPENQ